MKLLATASRERDFFSHDEELWLLARSDGMSRQRYDDAVAEVDRIPAAAIQPDNLPARDLRDVAVEAGMTPIEYDRFLEQHRARLERIPILAEQPVRPTTARATFQIAPGS